MHTHSSALALGRMALMVVQTGVYRSKTGVIEYARRTIDMIVQVGRWDGKRGVLKIALPADDRRIGPNISHSVQTGEAHRR